MVDNVQYHVPHLRYITVFLKQMLIYFNVKHLIQSIY